MGPAGTGRTGHLPPGNVVILLFVLQMLSKVSVDEVFIHFEKMSSALLLDPAVGGLPSSDPLIAHPGKNPADAHAICKCSVSRSYTVPITVFSPGNYLN